MGGGGGLGNLADELADALSDGEDDEYYDDNTGAPDVSFDVQEAGTDGVEGQRDSGVDVDPSPKHLTHSKNMSLSLPSPNHGRHRRAGSEYDGSEYGSESDLDSPSMPPSLVAKIDAVESLARRGTENNGSQTDGVFTRVTDSLRDLGSQSGVEGGATRYVQATLLNVLRRQMLTQGQVDHGSFRADHSLDSSNAAGPDLGVSPAVASCGTARP